MKKILLLLSLSIFLAGCDLLSDNNTETPPNTPEKTTNIILPITEKPETTKTIPTTKKPETSKPAQTETTLSESPPPTQSEKSPPEKPELVAYDKPIETDKQYIYFYLVSPVGDYMDDPDYYLVPVHKEIKTQLNSTEEKMSQALTALFTIKTFLFEDTELHNMLYLSNLSVNKIETLNNTTHVDLKGTIWGIGSIADIFHKRQIIKTIEHYTKNFYITLNGSESEWRCALDVKGDCK